ncbi:MAG: 2-amino-4-hydroxy-6-hydroxymethyldihydropteridine diphosphokinase [Rhodopseudomonas sp.]|nr:2-amino-4-hydroxy-6-hydroxymethyldihydropteridine diphosphokinase [Rhodopseudomonas sp.]
MTDAPPAPSRLAPASPVQAYLGLGGNVGNSRAILGRAVTLLCDDRAVKLTARSSDYSTPPWGFKYQPPFINLCIAVETSLSPRALLTRAQEVELALGRDRAHEKRWGPRTADIDILAYGDLSCDEPGLILPHPHMFERAFVLLPLAEIAGDRTIAGRSVSAALAEVDSTGIQRLVPLP